MRKELTIMCLLTLAFAFLAIAETPSKETFFRSRIEARIAKCERQCALVNGAGSNIRAYGEKARRELVFLRDNKDMLVGKMVERDLPMKVHKVDHFLIKAYGERGSAVAVKK